MSADTDQVEMQLLQRIASGDTAALECLLLLRRAQLLAYVSWHTPEDVRRFSEPQDILQDIYYEAFRRIGSFSAPDMRAALRWLVRIARNRIVDLIRMQRAAKRGGLHTTEESRLPSSDDEAVMLLQELAVHERTPSRSAMSHELIAALQVALDRLPQDYRQALRLRYIEGLAVEDIAARMNRTSHAVHMLCNRGLKAMRAQMQSVS